MKKKTKSVNIMDEMIKDKFDELMRLINDKQFALLLIYEKPDRNQQLINASNDIFLIGALTRTLMLVQERLRTNTTTQQ